MDETHGAAVPPPPQTPPPVPTSLSQAWLPDAAPRPGLPDGGTPSGGARSGRRRFLWILPAVVVAALLVALAVFLPHAFVQKAVPAAPALRPASQAEVQTTLDRAALALRLRDRAAYRAALPAVDRDARQARDQLYARLAQLPWSSFSFHLTPIPGEPGRFDVFGAGQLGRVGPADRIGGERVLQFERRGRRVVAVGDVTPPALRRRFLMAFSDAVAVQRAGGIVVADRSWMPLAVKLGGDFAEARQLIAATGIKPGAPLAVYLYSSSGELHAAVGERSSETRIRFFSVNVDRISPGVWTTRDVGVLAPELAGQDAWRPRMLAHELTHAYTIGWFSHTKHQPTLLVEGLATMVEGGRSYWPLRQDLASGRPQLPLLTAIAMGSLWMGSSTDRVHLGYLEGASLVGYVLHRWGLHRLHRWTVAVADSDLSRQGLDAAGRSTLGVGWGALAAGWRAYVFTLP
jgi:hypothetical protein